MSVCDARLNTVNDPQKKRPLQSFFPANALTAPLWPSVGHLYLIFLVAKHFASMWQVMEISKKKLHCFLFNKKNFKVIL